MTESVKKRPGTYARTAAHRAASGERAREQIKGWKNDGHPFWKGEQAGYAAKHEWAYRQWGNARKCEHCDSEGSMVYDWANVSGEYLRDRSDWLRLCRSCHQKFDRRRSPNPSWIEFRGERRSIKEWAEIVGMDYQRLYQRLRKLGWTAERAITAGRYAQ